MSPSSLSLRRACDVTTLAIIATDVGLSGERRLLNGERAAVAWGVDDNPILRNVFLRVMQSRNEFPFRWFCAPVSWVQCHSLINPPVQGAKVNLKDKNAVKEINELGNIPRTT